MMHKIIATMAQVVSALANKELAFLRVANRCHGAPILVLNPDVGSGMRVAASRVRDTLRMIPETDMR